MLAGPSGAGKSTLLRALAGLLLTADAGELSGAVTVDGSPTGSRPGQAGLLLQDPADALVAATVGRDVAFGPENLALARPQIWTRVADALAAASFPYGGAHASAQLSGGEGQRLALAGGLALRPGLMLLDEPTSMLDAEAAAVVRGAVLAATAGATLVVVEHRLEAWADAMDRVVVLSAAGRIVADGEPAAVFAEHGGWLADHGVWVPGQPDPAPQPMGAGAAGPWRRPAEAAVGTGGWADTALLAASGVEVAGRLEPVDLQLEPGQVVAVTGPSGSGKSTLLAVLAGRLRPSGGAVRAGPGLAGLAGSDPAGWSSADLAARVGWVAQHPESGFVAATVRHEVLAGTTGRDHEPTAEAAAARADRLLDALGLAGLAEVDPHRLSGGEQRRLAVAAALAQGPQVLLLDEPTLGQDRRTWAAVAGAVDAARRAGTAVAVATHDHQLLRALAPDLTVRLAGRGRHHPGSTAGSRAPAAARCGPLAILLVSLLTVLGSVFVRDWRVGLVTLAVQLALAPLAVRRLRTALSRLTPGLVAALSIGWSSWLLGGHELTTGVSAGLRILVLVVPGALLTAHLDPSRLGDDLAQRLRLPARPVVATVAALQRVEDLDRVWADAAWARRVRGLGAGRSPIARSREAAALTFVLLVQSIRQAGRMAVAMDARGFAGARRRTWAEPSRWHRSDTVLAVVGAVVAALPVTLSAILAASA
jgi:energy-coupling factor transporter ATP-binding protein EcfA2/energy-coupling factor transporter transmembrane protein EcfT